MRASNTSKHAPAAIPNRAAEVSELIDAVKALIVPFIADADNAFPEREQGGPVGTSSADLPVRTALVEPLKPQSVVSRLGLDLPEGNGGGRAALLETVKRVLDLSVNTWDQGFLDKLYASTTPVGVVAELVLSVLNTNVHVFQVSPALTVIEKTTARALARRFGFMGPRAGGITCAGGSASNFTSLIVARNTLFPETKEDGNGAGRRFALFTSQHGHYSVEKAAQAAGLGSRAVWTVAVDAGGCIVASELEARIVAAKTAGFTPLYINATAGTTVMGSYDPFEAIAAIAKTHGLWLHIDGSWGGPAIFSAQQRHKLLGSHLADSLTVNPHKMMNVPTTCSFLLGPDLSLFHRANTLPAGYLFHEGEDNKNEAETETKTDEVWDLADLTLQCGRHADSFKLALAWVYEGAAGFERQVDHSFAMAALLAQQIAQRPHLFVLVSANPPPCLQVCFYYGQDGRPDADSRVNSRRTSTAARLLVRRGYMVDFAPGPCGSFFRVVLNWQTRPGTIQGLITALEAVRQEIS
ncbi:pyridoxal phosphate-dependent decarboxylase [Grosmannia clavigera kw1407]|uniref:Pyridoxal phosphate-dependent decarboxylase n=1 Tax=Grosmannia clavigera (strain kw1407 / UAMH 11150) TaxID=655863 RepID=F0XEJ3_GROCL|nr:pyridoxal phosphate-dependent decarboxylase [Grosmannia clavigera kw1407]EFX04157.1 pyridoxal phosphate-dependent decarboxylase [Grosmannia clavigera kw1407]